MRDDEYRAMFDLEDRLWWYSGMRSITRALLEIPRLSPDIKLLDVGCGTGYSMLWLRQELGLSTSYGVDLSPRAAELWKERKIDTGMIARADLLPFGDKTFDLLTCFDVVYQLTPDHIREALREYYRVLSPGGLLMIREPAYNWLRGSHDKAVGTRHRFNRQELIEMLIGAGFRVRRATYANSLLLWLALPHRLLTRRSEESDVRPIPDLLNRVFKSALNIEAAIIRRVSLPFGLSVIALAERPS